MAAQVAGTLLAEAVANRHSEISQSLLDVDPTEFQQPSRLPGWDRLTIVSHLRYGAAASHRMTEDALDGRPTAFYPVGRETQRAATLRPDANERPAEVVASLAEWSQQLDGLWLRLDEQDWHLPVKEPDDNQDLGDITLWTLALLRLTEVEVHGGDLDLDLSPWSDTFISAALPMRLHWLPTRRSNHQPVDQSPDGNWAFISTDGPSFLVSARGATVRVHEDADESQAHASIIGSGRQLLAFILGRVAIDSLEIRGDRNLAASFLAAFPAP